MHHLSKCYLLCVKIRNLKPIKIIGKFKLTLRSTCWEDETEHKFDIAN